MKPPGCGLPPALSKPPLDVGGPERRVQVVPPRHCIFTIQKYAVYHRLQHTL